MDNNIDDIQPRGAEIIPHNSQLNKPKQMERIVSMGKVGAQQTTELLVALGTLASAIKVSLKDGKITVADSINFVPAFMPLVNGITGIGEIPAEFADGFDPVEQDEMGSALADSLSGFEGNVPELAKAGLQVLFSLQNFLKVAGIIKTNDGSGEVPSNG